MRTVDSRLDFDPPAIAAPDAAAEIVPAWELIEAGRYMPRRIKGSHPGMALG